MFPAYYKTQIRCNMNLFYPPSVCFHKCGGLGVLIYNDCRFRTRKFVLGAYSNPILTCLYIMAAAFIQMYKNVSQHKPASSALARGAMQRGTTPSDSDSTTATSNMLLFTVPLQLILPREALSTHETGNFPGASDIHDVGTCVSLSSVVLATMRSLLHPSGPITIV